MRVVIDRSVLVAAIRSPTGASMELLRLALDEHIELLISTALVLEYEAVLTRPEQLRVSNLSLHDIDFLLNDICNVATEMIIHWQWRPQLTDADDEMVLETAINGRADAIVTFNTGDFARSATRFGIAVLLPGDALSRLENS